METTVAKRLESDCSETSWNEAICDLDDYRETSITKRLVGEITFSENDYVEMS